MSRAITSAARGSDLALWQSRTVLAALRTPRAGARLAFGHHGHRHARRSRSVAVAGRQDGERLLHARARARAARPAHRSGGAFAQGSADRRARRASRIARSCRAPRAADWLLVRREFHAPREDGLLPLKAGARVGASSLRRGALLGRFAPQAVSVPLRGNVPTRLRKLAERSERRCHRAGGRGAHAPAARSVARSWSSSCRPNGGFRRRGRARWPRSAGPATPKSKRRSALLADAACVDGDALGARIPARHRGRLLHALRLLRDRHARAPRHRHRARLGGAAASNFRQDLSREDRNVTHSSAEPSPAASPSNSQKLPLARSAELYSRAEALIPAGVSSPVRAFRKVGGTPVFFREAQRRVRHRRRRQPLSRFLHGLGSADPRSCASRAWSRPCSARPPMAWRSAPRIAREGELAERVLAAYPYAKLVRFVVSGTEAVATAVRIARASQRPPPHPQVRRLLPRPRRFADGEGRQRRDHAGPGRQRRRAGAGCGGHAGDSARRRRRARAGVPRAGQGHRRRHHRAAARQQRPAAAVARIPAEAARAHARAWRRADLRRGDHRLPLRLSRLRQVVRHRARPHHARQDRRRRPAGGGGAGPARAAGAAGAARARSTRRAPWREIPCAWPPASRRSPSSPRAASTGTSRCWANTWMPRSRAMRCKAQAQLPRVGPIVWPYFDARGGAAGGGIVDQCRAPSTNITAAIAAGWRAACTCRRRRTRCASCRRLTPPPMSINCSTCWQTSGKA